MLVADVGVEATQDIIQDLTGRVARRQLSDAEALMDALRSDMQAILEPCSQPLRIPEDVRPYVILMVGINGAGKTTTIGKLANRLQSRGLKVMLAAGDTFRAAAIEQLQSWGKRNDVPVVSQHQGADSASVIFDALKSAQSRGFDVLIADTAGRLHTQDNLMRELAKIRSVVARKIPNAPHEVLLVLDATTGSNGIEQAQQFGATAGVNGVVLTKLDGTAKGGVILAIAETLKLPVRWVGVGEDVDDLLPFEAESFVDSLLDIDT